MSQYRLIKNKLARLLVFGFIFISPVMLLAQGGKQNKKELENKKSKLKAEINTINELLHETKTSKKLSMNQVAMLNTKLKVREELISTISSEIRLINNQINSNQKEVTDLNANLTKLKTEYARMIYYGYRNKDSYNKLMFIFAAGDFNQAFQRLKYIQQYNEYRKKQAEAITKTQIQISEKIVELESKKNEKKQLLTGEEQEKLNLAKEKTEQEGVLVQLQDKEKQLKDELDQKKRDSEALNAAIKKLIQDEIRKQQEAEKARLAEVKRKKDEKEKAKNAKNPKNPKTTTNPKTDVAVKDDPKSTENKPVVLELTKEAEELSADFASNKGKLPWPVTKGVITDGFGPHEHPSIKGFIVDNKGVDISTTKGASCRALFGGEVTGVVNVPGSGRVVIIRHGEYLSVYTNLEEVTVKTGDKITSKQTIGSVSFNDDEDKTVMNLQIWKGQKILNPEDWLYR
ncbi:MAG: peptidoglycan DD-metalloendopeptidase family protein [Bacteroidetes bacterium]|nr:peptidoglycan DD-metalloendopeptidase family protein [Bacteroidota bacterium]